MDECLICSESPCTCLGQETPARRTSARASRRLPTSKPAIDRKPVRKFTTHTGREPEPKDSVDTDAPGEDEVLADAIRCLAPLLSDRELKRHGMERPNALPDLDKRRRKFRAEVVWSEARYR